jgi:hypothetical protein
MIEISVTECEVVSIVAGSRVRRGHDDESISDSTVGHPLELRSDWK